MHISTRVYFIYFSPVHAKSLQSCPTLCDPMDCSPPGASVHGILQARILEWVAMSSSRGSSRLRDWTPISYVYLLCLEASLPLPPPGKPFQSSECVLVAQSCPTLCDLTNYSPPGSSVRGNLQARTLEWIAVPFLQRIFLTQGLNPGLLHRRQILYGLSYREVLSVLWAMLKEVILRSSSYTEC